jgi:hypothetical protein
LGSEGCNCGSCRGEVFSLSHEPEGGSLTEINRFRNALCSGNSLGLGAGLSWSVRQRGVP